MTGDDLRALSAEAVMDVDGEQQYGIVITRKQRDALADLIDAAQNVGHSNACNAYFSHTADGTGPVECQCASAPVLAALAALDQKSPA